MNKNELIEGIARKTDSTKGQAERTIRAMLEVISETLEKGESISLPGFGTFEVRERGERTGRNPQTGKELKIAASRVPAFKPGATLKAAVNGSGE
jgi:DNA-binding protein HU-beta